MPSQSGCPMTTGSTAVKSTVVNLQTNTPPSISNMGNQTINEDGNTGNIGFTVSDGETSAGSLTVTATSSNTTLVPNNSSNLTLGGSGGSRTIKVTPVANKYGTATITVTVSDGAVSTSDTFVVTVNSVNDAPTISNIGNRTIYEDGNTGNIAFSIGDVETSTSSLTVTATSSNTTLVPNSSGNLTLGGSGGSRTIKVTPVANKYGTATITVNVSDGSLSASDTFVVTVNSVNDIPTISAIGNVTLNEGASTGGISFTVGDVETSASLTVTASSSNTTVIPSGNIALGGSGASRTIIVTARPYGGAGSSTITVTVSDGQESRIETFTVTVNDIPAVLTVPATDSDGNGTYTISWIGGESVTRVWEKAPGGSWVNLSASASGTVDGPYGEKTLTQTQNGTYEYSLEDCYYEATMGGATLHCNQTDSGSIVVSGVNSLPGISNIDNQTISEGGSTNNISFTVSDPETSAGSLTVTATSDNTTLVPNNSSNLTLGGSGGSRTIKVTPVPDKYGTATITVTVSDGQLSVSDTFAVTVNDIPAELTVPASDNDGTYTISWVGGNTVVRIWEKIGSGDWINISTQEFFPPYGNQTITHLSNGTYQYKIDDCYFEGSAYDGTNEVCTTTDTGSVVVTLPVPTATAGFSPTVISEGGSATFSWSSTDANNCTASGIAGVSGTSGSITYNASSTLSSNQTVNVTVTCTGYGGIANAGGTVTVNWINDTPIISDIPNQMISEDGNTGDLTFTVSDEETAASSLIVTATSGNTALIPNGNITLLGTGASRTVRVTPVANQSGTAIVTVSVSDGVNPPVSDTFRVIVSAVNDVPTITSFSNLSIPQDTTTDALPFSIGDVETPAALLTVSAYSSDIVLVPNANLVLGGSDGSRTLMVIPASGQTGIATITVEVSDGQDSASTSFEVSVVGQPDPFDFNTDAPPDFQYDLSDTTFLPALGAGEFVALTEGSVSVDQGEAHYSVPIELPPAVRGLKPDLALNYNSWGDNGMLGVGWSLSGLSMISRCSPTYATEGTEAQDSNPEYTNADRLCLDGQKLEIASSTTPTSDSDYWAVGAEYRTEIDSFAKVQAFGTLNGGHQYFQVSTKDGRILTYGDGSASQNSLIYAPGQGSTGPVRIWALDKVEDRYGNQYTIHYQNNNADGDYYPTYISWAPGAAVVFSYVDRASVTGPNGERSDLPWGYDVGNLYKHPKLLQTITTYVDVTNPSSPSAGTPVREYELTYTRSPTTHRYRVSQIGECGFNGGTPVCAKPLSFDWQAGELGFDFDVSNNILQSCSGQAIDTTHLMVGDIDNDGYDDLFGGGLLYWGGPTCFTMAGAWATPGAADWKTQLLIATPRGRALLVTEEDSNSGSTPKTQFINIIELDRATSTANSRRLNTTSVSPTTVLVRDLNNDGREDFLFGESAWIQQNTDPVSFSPGTSNASLMTTGVCTPVEYNSDGLTDLFVHRYTPVNQEYSYTPIYARKNTGNGLFSSIEFSLSVSDAQVHEIATDSCASPAYFPGSMAYNLLDVNGDGKGDYAYHRKSEGESNGTWYVGLNTGAGFGSAIDTGLSSGSRNNQYSYAYDWDKDGRQDLIVTNTTYDGWRVLMSTWNDGAPAFQLAPNIDPFNGNMGNLAGLEFANPQANILRGDFNNDGLVDVAIGAFVWYAKQQQPDLLKTVTTGLGAQVTLEYSPLVHDDNNGQPLYTPSSQKPVFPQQHAQRSMQVVKKLKVSDGQGGWHERYFNYTGGKGDVQGRGFLGFEKIQVTDIARDKVTIVTYRQDFPYIGNVASVEVKDTAGNLISLMDNHYAVHSLNSRFPYLDYSIQQQYGLTTTSSGSPLSVTKTQNIEFDAYGNLLNQTITTGSGLSDTTVTGIKRVVTVDNTVTNNTLNWLIGFVTQHKETVATDSAGANARTVTTNFEAQTQPDTLDVKVRTDFAGTPVQKTTTTTRSANGVITKIEKQANDALSSTGTTEVRSVALEDFASIGPIYPKYRKNKLDSDPNHDHVTILGYNLKFGVVNSETDPNSLIATRVYDALGRLASETGPDGTVSTTKRFYCASAPVTCPANAVYLVATEITNSGATGKLGAPLSVVFYDKLQREVYRQTYSLNGAVAKVGTEYYADGRVYRVSEPYTGVSASHWTVSSNYDALNRPHDTSGADGGSVHTDYTQEGDLQKTVATVTVITPEGNRIQTTTRYTNALGQVERVVDDAGTPIDYTYDTQGNLKTTTVNNNAATTVAVIHDVAGNKTSIDDPDAGSIDFEYNGFGELRRQIWQPGMVDEKSIEYTYDNLGRKTGRTDTPVGGTPVTTYSWSWDVTKKGRLDSRSGNGFTESYTYDSQARLATRTTAISGLMSSRTFSYTYDAFSRPETVTYPDGLKVEHRYHAAGIQAQTRDITDPLNPKVLWALGENSDARGNLYQQLFGNGVMTEGTVDESSGRISRIRSGRLLGNSVNDLTGSVQDLSFEFDTLGNLYERDTSRTDLNGQQIEYTAEIFDYDDLNRLKTSDTLWDSLGTRSRSYNYDAMGNLTYRSDIGTLTYDQTNGGGVHAVKAANGQSYHYDAYGNVVQRGTDMLEYDVFNKPTKIGTTTFRYGPDHARFEQVDGARATYYIGGQYEEIIDNGVTTLRSYVGGYLVRSTTAGTTTLTYLHTDHLGSVEAMSDELGNFIGRMSFDPWGNRQDADWEDGNPTGGDPDYYPTTKGFTGHEMLDQVNLIHMNGRVYDPVIGRFLTPDILVQSPYNSQSYNRYSYVFNNPLSFVDPTGYCGSAMESYFSAMISAGLAVTPLWMKFEGAVLPPVLTPQQQRQLEKRMKRGYTRQELMEMQANNDGGETLREIRELKGELSNKAAQARAAANKIYDAIDKYIEENGNENIPITHAQIESLMLADKLTMDEARALGSYDNLSLWGALGKMKGAGDSRFSAYSGSTFDITDGPWKGVHSAQDINYYYIGLVGAASGLSRFATMSIAAGYNLSGYNPYTDIWWKKFNNFGPYNIAQAPISAVWAGRGYDFSKGN